MSEVLPEGVQDELLRALEKESGQNVYACYQCGNCTAACPFGFSPQRVMRYLQLGQVEQALSAETTWICASCMTCNVVCPKGVEPARVMGSLRNVRRGLLSGESSEALQHPGRRELKELADTQFSDHKHALRSFFFANIHDISRLGSRLAPLSNWLGKAPGARLAAHHLLGVHKERELPEFVRPSFLDWFREHTPLSDGHRGEVVLFHDTFMDYDAPEIGVAAAELLELAGYRVALSDTMCCGRPMISKGYMDKATECARVNVERLFAQAEQGVFIVGCEPSCLLTVREEYPRMLPEGELRKKAERVAAQCRLIDEFLIELRDEDELELVFPTDGENGRPRVLFHGHCQQKAEADAGKSLELLQLAGLDAELVRAPCCGMAGAFGFEKEHYEESKQAFNRALGPAIAAEPDAQLVVMGISCRKQIEHFGQRKPRHLTEMLRSRVLLS